MRKVIISLALFILILLTGCVSQTKYNELQTEYGALKSDYETLKSDYETARQVRDEALGQLDELQVEVNQLKKIQLEYELKTKRLNLDGVIPFRRSSGSLIQLINNPVATDPALKELYDFLKSDKTEDFMYQEGAFVCAEAAELLHNKAEQAGIKTALVFCYFVGKDIGHVFNAFHLGDEDRLIFVDSTPTKFGYGADVIIKITIGEPLVYEFPQWEKELDMFILNQPRDTVEGFEIFW